MVVFEREECAVVAAVLLKETGGSVGDDGIHLVREGRCECFGGMFGEEMALVDECVRE
jgi:hypothetical protein